MGREKGPIFSDIRLIFYLHHAGIYDTLMIPNMKGGESMAKKKSETINRHIRYIPEEVDLHLRVEAARRRITINSYILEILTKEAKRLEKKGG